MPAGSINGIVSSLDTASIIEAILQYESRNADLINARKAEVTNTMTSWNSVSAYLLGFKSKASVLSKSSSWETKSITNSDDEILTAAASSDAAPGTYYIAVNALAQQHQLASQGFSASSSSIGTGTVVIASGSNASRTLTIDADNNTLEGLRDAINEADAGVNASIINDGSSANPYRLILSATNTGLENAISYTSDLSGGTAPDFDTSSFDTPETLDWNANATSTVSLGSTASYAGSQNKTYTFTVQGSGSKTVGTDSIDIGWSDGTNTGTITVAAADTEVALTGTGSDGLTLSLAAGTLYGGDTFQVQTFSPEIQKAADAQIAIGREAPIIVTSSSNTISDVIEGVTLDLLKISVSGPNTLTIDIDKNGITSKIQEFLDEYNNLIDYLGNLTSYNTETKRAGILIGDSGIINMESTVRRLMTNPVEGLPSNLNRLMSLGIVVGRDGHLDLDSSTLSEKLDDDLQGVINLFKSIGQSSDDKVEFISMTDNTVMSASGYAVNITQAATQGIYKGTSITDPAVENLNIDSTNYKFKIRLNGTLSEDIELTRKSYTSGTELAEEIEAQINADADLSANDVTVSWVDQGANGYFEVQSTKYGSNSKVEMLSSSDNSAAVNLGFVSGTITNGLDVAGTINGESASGTGQFLTGDEDNENTAGLTLKVTLTEDVLSETGNEATITLTRGVASLVSYELNRFTDSNDGSIVSRVNGFQRQIELYDNQLKDLNARLEKRRAQLYQQFNAMEQTLGQLRTQESYFSAQVAQLDNMKIS